MTKSQYSLNIPYYFPLSLSNLKYAEAGGIPLHKLKEKIVAQGVTQHMPEGKLDALLLHADTDADRNLDYDEFITLVCEGFLLNVLVYFII